MDWFQDDGVFLPMINDTGRNLFYKSCIDSVSKDKIICDIGAGTGFLTLLAIQSGARKVIAIEKDVERFNFLQSNIKKLDITDKVELIHSDFLDVAVSADYFVTETFGNSIFEENILNIAEKRKQLGGKIIPSQIEIYIKVFQPHPIFAVVQQESDAYEFQPDINIDENFYSLINDKYLQSLSQKKLRQRSNWINNLFKEYKKMNDLKLFEIYKSEPIIVNLDQEFPKLEFNLPSTVPPGQFCLFWNLRFNDIVMDVTDTIWATPTRYIPDTSKGIKIYYDYINSWWFEWQ